jgi:hypothetical protein
MEDEWRMEGEAVMAHGFPMRTAHCSETSAAAGAVKSGGMSAGSTKQPSRGPPLKELQQKRWKVENFVGGEPVVLGEAEVKRSETVYVAHCSDMVLQVRITL